MLGLLATRHQRTHPALIPVSKAVTRFTYPGGVEGWVDLGDLITSRPGIEPATAWTKVRRLNRCVTKTWNKTPLSYGAARSSDDAIPSIASNTVVVVACNCNDLGSLREDCEQMTGRCVCRPGVTGQKCNLCPNGKRLSPTGCTGLPILTLPQH